VKATELLKSQHREVKGLFRKVKKASGAKARRSGLEEIASKLLAHMAIEEDIFYPAVKEIGTKKTEELVPEAYEEHHVAKLVIGELPKVDPEDERFEAKMTVLAELIDHHVEEEETEMFKIAEKLGAERLAELGAEMKAAFDPQPVKVAAAGGAR
jgi:hypothetical protein